MSTMKPVVSVWRVHPEAKLPEKQHTTDVGFDLFTIEEIAFEKKFEYKEVRLGLVVKPPSGTYVEIYPRSSLFRKWGLILANGVGIIDPSYCGPEDELKALLLAHNPVTVPKHTRILQMIVRLNPAIEIEEKITFIDNTSRGGIGSTGDK